MFYTQLQKLCKERGEKITPLIKKLAMSSGNLSRWQNSISPTGDTLIKFAKYFGVSRDYLLGLSEQKNNFTLIKTEEKKMEKSMTNLTVFSSNGSVYISQQKYKRW